jgi:non-homologous end joining protein Ku
MEPARTTNVVNLMEALKNSLGKEQAVKAKSAKRRKVK